MIGERVGDTLHINAIKQISNKKDEFKHEGRLYPVISTETNMMIKSLLRERELHLMDKDWGSDIIGIQNKYANMQDRTEEDLEKMKDEIEQAKAKGKPAPNFKMNINPQFSISAVKLYNWFYVKMLVAAYGAIIKNIATKQGQLGFIVLGIVIGGMGGYIIVPHFQSPQVITETQTITDNCPTLNITTGVTTAITQTVNSSCFSQIISSLSSSQTSTHITQSTQTATVVAISSFNNGTVFWRYSNGTNICKANC